jgi:hypothetical protein
MESTFPDPTWDLGTCQKHDVSYLGPSSIDKQVTTLWSMIPGSEFKRGCMYINGKIAPTGSTISSGVTSFVDDAQINSYPSKRIYCLAMEVYVNLAKTKLITYLQCSRGLFYVRAL